VANAGVTNYGTVRTADPEEFARTVAVNLVGAYRTVGAAVPHLVRRRGYALLVASVASFVPVPGAAAYSASKAGRGVPGGRAAVGAGTTGWPWAARIPRGRTRTWSGARCSFPWSGNGEPIPSTSPG